MKYIYITCLNSIKYLYGVLILNYSFRKNNENEKLYVLCNDEIYNKYGNLLKNENMELIVAKDIAIEDKIKERLNKGNLSHWIKTFFKINIFNLTQYDKIIYLDADMLIMKSLSELINKNTISAVDDGDFMLLEDFHEGLNSGLMVLKPSKKDYQQMINIISQVEKKREVFGDQNVIQEIYKDFHDKKTQHLDISYNACFYLLDKYKNKEFKIIHFMGSKKPWNWNLGYAFIRINSYLLRGRFYTYKYTLIYYLLFLKFKKKYGKIIKY